MVHEKLLSLGEDPTGGERCDGVGQGSESTGDTILADDSGTVLK